MGLTLGPYTSASGTVALPGSKSISNRVLLLAALACGTTVIDHLLDAEDTCLMLNALEKLGVQYVRNGERCIVTGTGGTFPIKSAELFLGNAGTAVRLLTAVLAMNQGEYRIAGVPRMHERPIGDLVDSLRQMGAAIDYLERDGFLPIAIHPAPLPIRAPRVPIRIRGDVSSQFLTALLMALPQIPASQHNTYKTISKNTNTNTNTNININSIVIEIDGDIISKPYIDMTIQLMARFGVRVKREDWHRLILPAASRYHSVNPLRVEGDASSASYFFAAGVIGRGPVRVTGVGQTSIQGDIGFTEVLAQMGANVIRSDHWIEVSLSHPATVANTLTPQEIDCSAIPDAAMTLAIIALFAKGASTLRNIGSWRVKETDRITAMATELRKLGAIIDTGQDWLRITPPTAIMPNADIETYDDHRIAMCFSLISLAGVPIKLRDPQCVKKTFPEYFKHFLKIVHPAARMPKQSPPKKTAETHIPIITIDGPTASGKGTLARAVSKKLGFHYLDSGVLYRLTALASWQRGIAVEDVQALAQLASTLNIVLQPGSDDIDDIQLDGQPVSQAIRQEQVGHIASMIAKYAPVRAALIKKQRAFRKPPGLVADGRDMGTIIFPEADLKIFLTADVLVRANRRYKQLLATGFPAKMTSLLENLKERDARDSQRDAAPLTPAKNAKMLDTSDLCIDAAVVKIIEWFDLTMKAKNKNISQ